MPNEYWDIEKKRSFKVGDWVRSIRSPEDHYRVVEVTDHGSIRVKAPGFENYLNYASRELEPVPQVGQDIVQEQPDLYWDVEKKGSPRLFFIVKVPRPGEDEQRISCRIIQGDERETVREWVPRHYVENVEGPQSVETLADAFVSIVSGVQNAFAENTDEGYADDEALRRVLSKLVKYNLDETGGIKK